MKREVGMTLPELLIVMTLTALVLAVTAAYSVPWMARESMRSAIYDLQTEIQTARIQAVSRNHDCRFEINTSTGEARVMDTMGTASTADDQVLSETEVTDSVAFARPDVGSAVTLALISGSWYGTTFTSEGTVSAGTGEICLFAGNRYGKLSVYAAGGVQAERWNGAAWESGL